MFDGIGRGVHCAPVPRYSTALRRAKVLSCKLRFSPSPEKYSSDASMNPRSEGSGNPYQRRDSYPTTHRLVLRLNIFFR